MAENTAAPPAPTTTDTPGEPIPYARFSEVVTERNKLQADLTAATETASQVPDLAGQIEALKTEHAAQTAAWQTDRGLMERGLMDDEGRDVARLIHGRLPAADRPDIGAWLDTLTTGGGDVPRALAGYLKPNTPPATTAPPAATTAPPATAAPILAKLPASNNGTTGAAPAAPQTLGVEKLREIRAECQRTGDWSPYQAIRDQLLHSLK